MSKSAKHEPYHSIRLQSVYNTCMSSKSDRSYQSNNEYSMATNQSNTEQPNATINKLETYIELLYEDLSDEIKASSLILELTRNTDNLIALSSNETLICALARVLREDGKKSLELAINIVHIFANFSNYSQFHSSISQFKVGSICFDLIECELNREQSWFRELNEKRSLNDTQHNLQHSSQPDFEKSLKKYKKLVKKQNNFLRICYFLLHNLSEDSKVELKMINRGIIPLLMKTLERDSQDLLEIVVRFLKKLSIYLENKNQMKDLGIIEKLAPVLSVNNEKLVSITLVLMHNLVFDLQLRTIMIKIGLIPKLISFLAKNRHTDTILTILYQVSREDKWKSLFSYSSDCINLIISKVFDENSNYYNQAICLAINLALNQRNAQLICDNFNKIFDKLFATNDPLLLKLMRNLSQHDDPIKMLFLDYYEPIVQLMVTTDNEEIVVECLPILANLTLNQINWYQLLTKYNLLDWIRERLKPGTSYEDDIILQIVIFIGTVVDQKQCALYLISNDIIKLLIDLLNANQDDDEIVTQIIYSFHVLIKHSDIRERILKSSQIADYLIDLMHDRNKQIKTVCNSALDVIAEYDAQWASKIKIEKFCAHNKQWLEMIESENSEHDINNDLYGSVVDDSLLYPELLLKTELLNDSSSDNQSDDHSVYLSLQGVSIHSDNSAVHTPILSQTIINTNKRPQTGYKNRVQTGY